MSRPDYVKCVLTGMHTAGDPQKPIRETWCGRIGDVDLFEWAFVDASHAALNGRAGGRLVACKACSAAIVKALANGVDD